MIEVEDISIEKNMVKEISKYEEKKGFRNGEKGVTRRQE